MIVLKFGGTSVADADALHRLLGIVAKESRSRVVVVSALAKVTDGLIEIGQLAAEGKGAEAESRIAALTRRHVDLAQVVRDAGARARLVSALRRRFLDLRTLVRAVVLVRGVSADALDAILAHGELASSRIVADALEDAGIPAAWVDSRSAIVTGAQHGHAEPNLPATTGLLQQVVQPHLASGRTVVLGGFIGATPAGVTTTLGRGGSDYSASIIGACLGADEIQIWTDVDGMLTADPRVLPSVLLVPRLSFEEAAELAELGAKVLHPATIQPAVERDIPVRIMNSKRADGSGTWITRTTDSDRPAAAIASLPAVTVLDVHASATVKNATFLSQVFAILEQLRIDPHVVTCSHGRVSAVIRSGDQVAAAAHALGALGDVKVVPDMALVCVVGHQLSEDRARVASIFNAVDGVPIRMVSRGASGRHVALVVPAPMMVTAVARLHDRLFPVEQDGEFRIDSLGAEATATAMRLWGWESWLSLEEPGDAWPVVD